MKKLLFCAFLLGIYSTSEAGLITHTDYTSGGTITATGQNANENRIYNEFNGNIDNTNIKSGGVTGTNIANGTITNANIAGGTVRGSTANSGGSAQELSQGTVSTADLRANAVTVSSAAQASNQASNGTAVDTATITTIGGPVLVLVNMSVQIAASGAGAGLTIAASTSTVNIPGALCTNDTTTPTSGNVIIACSFNNLVNLAAGTYTFKSYYALDNGSLGVSGVVRHSLQVIELRD